MGVKFFGAFLVEKGVITKEQLLEAIEEQKRTNMKLGEHAIKLGYLTSGEVAKIQELQKRKDLRFGEAAVELGLLTPKQVEELIRIQKSTHKLLGDILVEKGFITRETLERELKEFEKEQRIYMTEEVFLPAGVKERNFISIMIDLTKKFLLRTCDINTKFGTFEFSTKIQKRKYDVMMNFEGDINLKAIYSPPESFGEKILKAYSLEDKEELKKDAIAEFINIVAGNTISKVERLGKRVIPLPPTPTFETELKENALKYILTAPDEEYILYFIE